MLSCFFVLFHFMIHIFMTNHCKSFLFIRNVMYHASPLCALLTGLALWSPKRSEGHHSLGHPGGRNHLFAFQKKHDPKVFFLEIETFFWYRPPSFQRYHPKKAYSLYIGRNIGEHLNRQFCQIFPRKARLAQGSNIVRRWNWVSLWGSVCKRF